MLVAVAALAFAMVGTAVAGPSSVSKLTKSKVKSISKKQADKELKANVSGSHVNTADKATNADNASNAANAAAVGGQSVGKVFTKIATGTGATTVFSGNGLTLTVACPGGSLDINATTSVSDSYIGSNLDDSGTVNGNRSSDFDVGDNFDPLGGGSRGEGTITYVQSDGKYVNLVIGADDADTFGTFDGCHVTGTVFVG
jgi:hypothetical protein